MPGGLRQAASQPAPAPDQPAELLRRLHVLTPAKTLDRLLGPGFHSYDRALVLAALVRTMRDHYLAVRCGCGAGRVIAIRQMATNRRLADRTLAHVALRLACERCCNGPDEVFITETIYGVGPEPHGAVALGWAISLVQRPSDGARLLRPTYRS